MINKLTNRTGKMENSRNCILFKSRHLLTASTPITTPNRTATCPDPRVHKVSKSFWPTKRIVVDIGRVDKGGGNMGSTSSLSIRGRHYWLTFLDCSHIPSW